MCSFLKEEYTTTSPRFSLMFAPVIRELDSILNIDQSDRIIALVGPDLRDSNLATG
jgi:hypothetical protein